MKRSFILLSDIIIFFFSLGSALAIRNGFFSQPLFWDHTLPFSIILIFWLIVFYSFNLYDLSSLTNSLTFFNNVFKSLLINVGISVVFFYLNPQLEITPKTILVLHALIFFVLFGIFRYLTNLYLGISHKKKTLCIGSVLHFEDIANELSANPQLGYELKVLIDNDLEHESHKAVSDTFRSKHRIQIFPNFSDIKHIIETEHIDTVIVEPALYDSRKIIQALYECLPYQIQIVSLTTFSENVLKKIPLEATSQTWLLENIAGGKNIAYDTFKKVADVFCGFLGLVVLGILLPFVAAAIKMEDGGSVLYMQTRVGKNGTLFPIIKFRTMRQDAEKDGPKWAGDNDPRITKVGHFLRKTRLDEFPQVINILQGEMSVVGPRAERPEYYQLFIEKIPYYKERLLILPGLTGWAQVNYPYAASLEENSKKLQYDLYYLKNKSILLDCATILKTVSIVLRGVGK
jgi:exopolysaccharide biosynthesis polyprenyl glycosylphosphotransferase